MNKVVARTILVACLLAMLMGLAAETVLATDSALGSASESASESGAETAARKAVASTARFAFYSDFEANLFDALVRAATARAAHRRELMHGDAASCFDDLSQEQRSAWNEAVDYFATNVASTPDFSRERFIFRAHIAQLPIELDDDDRSDLGLGMLFLKAAAPAYRACRWPQQDRHNRAWIAALVPRLAQHETTIATRLEGLFGKAWRPGLIMVDVVETVGWAGADTVARHQTHIQISSRNPGYQGKAALEMIFHEASHELVSRNQCPITEGLAAAARTVGTSVPRDLWHALLFVSVGEVARDTLAVMGDTDYVPYADAQGVFAGRWKPLLEPLRTAWLPAVRGEAEQPQALRALLAALTH